jgi:hypothetical protein
VDTRRPHTPAHRPAEGRPGVGAACKAATAAISPVGVATSVTVCLAHPKVRPNQANRLGCESRCKSAANSTAGGEAL